MKHKTSALESNLPRITACVLLAAAVAAALISPVTTDPTTLFSLLP